MLNVQIVDDEPIVRLGLRKLIPWEELGFHVVCEAQNGKEALAQLDEYQIDLIITDIEMPFMDGIEYIRKIRELKGKQTIVVLTAHAEFDYARIAIKYGVTEYILKPIVEEQIINILEKIKENIGIFMNRHFTREQDNKLVEAVLLTDKQAFTLLEEIIEEEKELGSDDFSGTCFRFAYILEEIAQAVEKKYQNLNKLEKLDLYLEMSQKKYITKTTLINEFKNEVERLFSILEQYMLVYKDNIVRQACQYVVENVDDKISLTTISNTLGISKNYFCSLFKQETGENFLNFVTNTKMNRAKYLLKEKNMRVYEVCNFLGYTDTTYFTKLFKKHVGMTPNKYRKTECENYEFLE